MTEARRFLLVLDFEATCSEAEDRMTRKEKDAKREIIEFPVVMVDVSTGEVIREFHEYVRPTDGVAEWAARELDPFCTQLTGITQEQVNDAGTLPEVLGRLEEWLSSHELTSANAVFVTCGDWDLRDMLPTECKRKGIVIPEILTSNYVNIKTVYTNTYKRRAGGMKAMLKALGLKLEGHHHSGIADSRNIARIAIECLKRGGQFAVGQQHAIQIGYVRKQQPSVQRRAGDWDCSCGALVFASKRNCFKCDKPNPNGGGSGSQLKKGDWICGGCNALIYGSRHTDKCYKCGKHR